jgi:hypothetical protein
MQKVIRKSRSGFLAVFAFAVVGLFMLSNARPADAFPVMEIAAIIVAVSAAIQAVCGCRGGGGDG